MSCAAPKKTVDLQQSCKYNPTQLHQSDLHNSVDKSVDNSVDKSPEKSPSDKPDTKGNAENAAQQSEEKYFACEFRGDRVGTPFSLAPEAFEKLCGPIEEE